MNKQTKAMLDSYLRNLLGVALALITTTMASAGVASPLDFSVSEWLVVANGLWAAAVPTLIRYVSKKDPAFGLVAEVASKEVSKKLVEASKAAKKPVAKKAPAKKPAAKK
jgi:hypothetical protein